MNKLSLPHLMGHRGAPSLAPENTLAGFRAAYDAGARWTEADVCVLGDGTPVMFHDSTLDRCTDRSGSVETLSASDLASVNANRQFSDGPFAAIPRLNEALELFLELGMGLNLELKLHDHVAPQALVDAVASILRNQSFPLDQILLSSFDFDVLRATKAALPEFPLAVIADDFSPEVLDLARELEADSLNLWWERLNYEQTQTALQAGFTVNVWTANDAAAVSSMLSWGVTGFMSDCPQTFGPEFRA